MVFPAVFAGLAIAGSAMSVGTDLYRGYETRRYLRDYSRNTGVSVRYPARNGYYDIYKAYGRGLSSAGFGGGAWYRGYSSRYRPSYGSRNYDPMYC